jgi:diguanylate cyclase
VSPASQSTAGKGRRFVERIYRLRMMGLGLGFLCVASVFVLQHRGAVLWTLLILHGFIWPHLARRIALASRVPYRGEWINLLIDALLGGFWVVAMRFNILPSVLLLVMLSMDNIAAGGMRLYLYGMCAHLLGFAIGWLTLGLVFEPVTQMSTVLACLPFQIAYPLALGLSTYRISRKLAEQSRTLESLSRTDGLTGLLNRRHWENLLEQTYLHCRATQRAATLLLIDLDHFKRVNDTRGHPVGDAVLQVFADLLRRHFRNTDIIGRYGGEEFGVILPGAERPEGQASAERFLQAVREASLDGLEYPCTASIGVAPYSKSMPDYAAWLQAADVNLYRAKLQGRNRVVVAEVSQNHET